MEWGPLSSLVPSLHPRLPLSLGLLGLSYCWSKPWASSNRVLFVPKTSFHLGHVTQLELLLVFSLATGPKLWFRLSSLKKWMSLPCSSVSSSLMAQMSYGIGKSLGLREPSCLWTWLGTSVSVRSEHWLGEFPLQWPGCCWICLAHTCFVGLMRSHWRFTGLA